MHIIDLLRQHISKENNILFMMAEMHLDEKQKAAIKDLQAQNASAAEIYAKLIEFTWPKLDAQTIAY